MNEDAYGFQKQRVAGGAGVVIAGQQPPARPTTAETAKQPTQAVIAPSAAILIPFSDPAQRIRYLENVRDYLRNQETLVEAALKQERGL